MKSNPDENHITLNGSCGRADKNSTHQHDEELLREALFLPRNQIPFPDNDGWRDLGRIAREQSHKRKVPLLAYWAAAAVLVGLLIIGGLMLQSAEKSDSTIASTPKIQGSAVGKAEFVATTQIEALLIQTELDSLSLDLLDAEINDDEDEPIDIIDLLGSYEIDPVLVIDEYIRAL